MTGLTIIVPTLGRVSLVSTLHSIADQATEEDRVVVVEDSEFSQGSAALVRLFMRNEALRGNWSCFNVGRGAPLGAFGHGARNWLLDNWLDEGDHPYCCTIDDDDVYLPGALDTMREAINGWMMLSDRPYHWFIFQMVGGTKSHFKDITVPVMGTVLKLGNVGTPMLCWPHCGARFGVGQTPGTGLADYEDGYYGDFEMAQALQREWGDPIWVDHCVAIVRP